MFSPGHAACWIHYQKPTAYHRDSKLKAKHQFWTNSHRSVSPNDSPSDIKTREPWVPPLALFARVVWDWLNPFVKSCDWPPPNVIAMNRCKWCKKLTNQINTEQRNYMIHQALMVPFFKADTKASMLYLSSSHLDSEKNLIQLTIRS